MDLTMLEKIENAGLFTLNNYKLSEQLVELQKTDNQKVVICNCTGYDSKFNVGKYLAETELDSIISGVVECANIIGASQAIIYIGSYFLKEVPGDDIIEDTQVIFMAGADTLVSRNYTALFELLNSRIAQPFAPEEGPIARFNDSSALLIDCETAINVVNVINDIPAKKYIYLSGKGIISANFGTALSQLFNQHSIETGNIKGILLGGTLGKFVLPGELPNLTVSFSPLFNSVEILSDKNCIVDTAKKLMTEAFEQSCGKCVLCREATKQFKTILTEITEGKAQAEDVEMMIEMSELIRLGAFCSFGRNMVNPLTDSLSLFKTEFENHIKRKRCDSMVCAKFSSYIILPNECTGCEECLDACPEDAIEGKKGYIHMIDEDTCEKCGKCISVCPEGAIVKAGAVKPKLPTRLIRVGSFRK